MATVNLSTSPTQIDDGTSVSVLVTNTGASDVELSRGGRLRPAQSRTVYPEGTALSAAALSGTGQVSTVATAAPTSQAAQITANTAAVAANTAAIAGLPGTYGQILPAASTYTYNPDGTIATETVAGVTTTFTYNGDGSINTMTRSGVTRTFSYNGDGTLAGVA